MSSATDTCPHKLVGAHLGTCDAHADCEPGSDPDECPGTYAYVESHPDEFANPFADPDSESDPESYAAPAY